MTTFTQLPKHQSPLPTTVLPKTTLTQMLRQCNRVLSLGSNHLLNGRLTLKFLRTVKLKNSFLLYLIIYTDLLLIWRWQATGWWWWCTLCCAQKSSRNTCCAFHLWNIKSSILMTQFTKHYIGNSVFSIASYRNLTRSGRHWEYNCTPNTWPEKTKSKGNFTKFFRGWNRGPKNFNLNNILRCAPRKNNKGSPFLLLGRLVLIKDRDLFKQKLNTTCSTTVNFLWYNKRLERSQGGLLTAQEEDFEKPTTTTQVCKCYLSTSSVIVTIKIDIPLPHGAPGCQRHNS